MIDSYLKDSAFTAAVKRDAKVVKKVYERGTICQ